MIWVLRRRRGLAGLVEEEALCRYGNDPNRCCVEHTIRTSRKRSPIQILVDKKESF